MADFPEIFPAGSAAEVRDIDLDGEVVYVAGPDGKPVRYTEADAERDADEAERISAERLKNLTPGGKSLSGGSEHSPRVQVVLSAEVKNELARRADAANMSLSRFVRRVVDDYLTEHPA